MSGTDFLSSLQNATQAISTLGRTWATLEGVVTSPSTMVPVVVTTKGGRVAYVSVIAGGSDVGYLHNCQTVAQANDSNKLVVIKTTEAIYLAAVNFNNGLVIIPGTNQLVNVTYSLATVQVAT